MAWHGSIARLPRPRYRRSCRGRYHTGRQPGAALQNTAMCPAGPPPARSRTACAGGRSHSTQDTVISPVPLVPFLAALRVTPPRGSRPGAALFAGQATS